MNCVFPLIVALATGFQGADQKPGNRLTPENLAKVKIGMSLSEVKKLLGETELMVAVEEGVGWGCEGEGNISKNMAVPIRVGR